MLVQANDMLKYFPIDRKTMNMLNPIIDMTNTSRSETFTNNMNMATNDVSSRRMMQSGGKSTKRSVGETKKKWVASQQNWKCGHCSSQLNAWFEVDHKIRLEYGGSNHVNNLIALCRECHGKKTAEERL